MPFDSEKRSKIAQIRPRDKKGHFLTLKPKVKISGQANLLEKLVDTKGDPDSDSMMGIYFRNPLKKITEILLEIKNKQSTKVNLTIPLVALPIVILLAFNSGRYQSNCTNHFSSQVGTLQNVTITKSITPDSWLLKTLSYIPFASGVYDKKETLTQAVLIKEDSQAVVIENEANIDLEPFTQAKVIVFGDYNTCTETLILDSDKNISNY